MGLCLGAGPAAAGTASQQTQQPLRDGQKQQAGAAVQGSTFSTASTATASSSTDRGASHNSNASSDAKQRGGAKASGGSLDDSTGGSGSLRQSTSRRLSLSKPKKESIDTNYKLGQQLGEGNTATVREGVHKVSGERYAVKIFKKSKLTADDTRSLLEEVAILRYLEHPNIIRCLDFLEDGAHFYVVMDLVQGGELFDRITAKTSYTEKEARDLFIILVQAIRYLHDKSIVHRDLKPENLLLKDSSDDVTVKIADFGFAAKVDATDRSLTTQCGTPGYVAPEILKREGYGKPVDMWSIGVITYILLGGYPPFYDEDQRRLFEKIKHARYVFHPEIWAPVSNEAKDLIARMLTVDPRKRLTAEQALLHPWVLMNDASLHCHNLEASKAELKKFNARRKFRAGVRSIMAANKMSLVLANLREAAKQREQQEATQQQGQEEETRGAEETGGGAALDTQ